MAEEQRTKLLCWSRFRRTHQARAKVCHTQRRARQTPPVVPANEAPEPISLPGLPQLTDGLWEQLRPLFEPAQSKRGRPTDERRRHVEAVLWVAHGVLLATPARTLRTMGDHRVSLPPLVQRGDLGAGSSDSAFSGCLCYSMSFSSRSLTGLSGAVVLRKCPISSKASA